MAANKRNAKRSGSNAGTVFWLAAIVIVLFAFALNWGKIQGTLARTNFREIIKTQREADHGQAAKGRPKPEEGPLASSPRSAGPQVSPPASSSSGSLPPPASAPDSSQGLQAPAVEGETQGQSPQAPAGAQNPKVSSSATGARSRPASLFFVRIDDDGVIVRQEVKRQIPSSDSPLLDSLASLLRGPSEDEIRKRLISLIPQGTKLLSAQIRGSTAYLNFNEAFMYNHYGIEGYAGQLKQVVYTATSFPTVQDVQVLIEGEKHDYLGGEGVYIGRPLSRNSF